MATYRVEREDIQIVEHILFFFNDKLDIDIGHSWGPAADGHWEPSDEPHED